MFSLTRIPIKRHAIPEESESLPQALIVVQHPYHAQQKNDKHCRSGNRTPSQNPAGLRLYCRCLDQHGKEYYCRRKYVRSTVIKRRVLRHGSPQKKIDAIKYLLRGGQPDSTLDALVERSI